MKGEGGFLIEGEKEPKEEEQREKEKKRNGWKEEE